MNTLSATLTSVTASDHLSLLTVLVGEDTFHLLLVQSIHDPLGTPLTLVFKETEVILSPVSIPTTANIHPAMVTKIEQGVVLSHVTLLYHETTIAALVPTVTFIPLAIQEGETLYWMVQPSEISLLKETHGI